MPEHRSIRNVLRHVRVFAALGDPTRMAILERLSSGEPMSVTRLSQGRRVTRQAVSKHLRVLTEAGLVRSARHGRETRFSLRGERMDAAAQSLERIARQWDGALTRLKQTLEKPEHPE